MQRRRRMVHRHDPDVVDLAPLAVHLTDWRARDEPRQGIAAQRHDDARPDDLELLTEPVRTGADLLRQRVAVAWRSALDDVADEDVRALEADASQELLEELPGGTDERPALLILVIAGRLSDEHDLGIHGSFAGNCFRPLSAEGTGVAGGDTGV